MKKSNCTIMRKYNLPAPAALANAQLAFAQTVNQNYDPREGKTMSHIARQLRWLTLVVLVIFLGTLIAKCCFYFITTCV